MTTRGKTAAPHQVTITSEQDAWAALEQATTVGFASDVVLVFDGWPVFKIDIKGKDWDSTVPTRVMMPLLDVQKEINRAFASVRYGHDNLRKLKDEERDELEVVVKVKKGSSVFDAELWKHFTTIAQAATGRMDGNQTMLTVLGLAVLVAAPVMFKAWLGQRQKEKELDQQVQLSAAENRRMEIFAQAVARQPLLAGAQEDVGATNNKFLKVAKPGDVLLVGDQAVPASEAAALAQPERERAIDVTLDGVFAVLGNRTDKSAGFRITVKRLTDGLILNADVPIELQHDQQQLIQNAEWQKKSIVLSINASMLRGTIAQAIVVSAANAPS